MSIARDIASLLPRGPKLLLTLVIGTVLVFILKSYISPSPPAQPLSTVVDVPQPKEPSVKSPPRKKSASKSSSKRTVHPDPFKIAGDPACHWRNFTVRDKKNEELDVDYMVVESPSAVKKGWMLIFHGCGHSHWDYCKTSKDCVFCHLLPEEAKVVRAANARGLDVLAISSTARFGCWEQDLDMGANQDIKSVIEVLRKEGIIQNPNSYVIVFGASSGASFAPRLMNVLTPKQLKGLIMQIAAPDLSPFIKPGFCKETAFFWSLMTADTATLERGAHEMSRRKKEGCFVKMWTHHPFPIDPLFFHTRLPERVDPEVSQEMVSALKKDNYLKPDGFLREDPRKTDWRVSVKDIVEDNQLWDNLLEDQSPISEEFNIAYGQHEFIGDPIVEMLDIIMNRTDRKQDL